MTDSTLLFLLGFLWVTQPAFLRWRDMNSMIVIVLCIRMVFWFDNQHSYNFGIDDLYSDYKT